MKNILLVVTALFVMGSAIAQGGSFHNQQWNWNNGSIGDDQAPTISSNGTLLDAIAREGECYIPAIVEADCSVVSKKVTTVDGISQGAVVLPAVTKLIRDKVLIAKAKVVYESVPALYEYVKSNILISEEKIEWKKGNFTSVQKKVNGTTYCLVKTPAVYEDKVTKKLRVKATTVKRKIPAVYAYYDRIAVIKPVRVKINHKTAATMANVKGCTEKAGHYEWRSVLCSENATLDRLKSVETALSKANYLDSKYVDGVIDKTTENAIRKYQRSKGMTVDGLVNIQTVKSLGVQ
jgi:hypothetical protein